MNMEQDIVPVRESTSYTMTELESKIAGTLLEAEQGNEITFTDPDGSIKESREATDTSNEEPHTFISALEDSDPTTQPVIDTQELDSIEFNSLVDHIREFPSAGTTFPLPSVVHSDASVRTVLPQVEDDDIYRDEAGEWSPYTRIAQDLRINKKKLQPYLQQISSFAGKDKCNRPVLLYNKTQLLAIPELQKFLALPMIDKTGVYKNDFGEWTPIALIVDRWGFYHEILNKYLLQVSKMPGRGRSGWETTLYNLTQLQAIPEFQKFLALPKVDKNGIYENSQGKWQLMTSIIMEFGIPKYILEPHLSKISVIGGKDLSSHETTLYNITQLLAITEVKKFLALPKVDKSGVYKNGEGEWRSITAVVTFLKVSKSKIVDEIRRNKEKVRTIPGRGRTSANRLLYNTGDIIRLPGIKDYQKNPNLHRYQQDALILSNDQVPLIYLQDATTALSSLFSEEEEL